MDDLTFDGSSGLDAALSGGARRRVSSSLLNAFLRVGGDSAVLIHKSERDLWQMEKDATGACYIRRLFDETGEPLRLASGSRVATTRKRFASVEGAALVDGHPHLTIVAGGKTLDVDMTSAASLGRAFSALRRLLR